VRNSAVEISARQWLIVSCISAAEFLEGCRNAHEGMEFICRFIPQNLGFQHATKCAELQRRARRTGRRFGENDARVQFNAENLLKSERYINETSYTNQTIYGITTPTVWRGTTGVRF